MQPTTETERQEPNILITGTPGTGKTILATQLANNIENLSHFNINELIKQEQYTEGYDKEFDSHILDEDKLLDAMEDKMAEGGQIVDYHSNDFFPQRFFDLVIVLRCDNSILHPRLVNRGYNEHKIQENIECEIMEVVLEEARESYPEEIVVELKSETMEDMESNLERIETWYNMYKEQHS